MFDTFTYAVITSFIAGISLITFITLLLNILLRHKKTTLVTCFIFILTIVGMYLYIPFHFLKTGFENEQPDKLQTAIKLSINPYEKRICWNFLASIYAHDNFKQGIKDGNKAIEYMEKSIQGEYEKYNLDTALLGIWYSIKGDSQKVFELNSKVKNNLATRNIYIMNNEYDKAITTFNPEKPTLMHYLLADLYKKTGKTKEYKEALTIADNVFNKNDKNCQNEKCRTQIKINKDRYLSVENYKKWIEQQRKEYKFE